jgi:hypothetical protein
MSMFISGGRSNIEEGEPVKIHCPLCGERGVEAKTYAQVERVKFLGIPVDRRTSWAVCSRCGKHLLSSRDVHDLPGSSEEELDKVLAPYASFISRSIALLALILSWVPIVGIVLVLLAILLNRRPGIWRTLSWIALGISLLAMAVLGILILSGV